MAKKKSPATRGVEIAHACATRQELQDTIDAMNSIKKIRFPVAKPPVKMPLAQPAPGSLVFVEDPSDDGGLSAINGTEP